MVSSAYTDDPSKDFRTRWEVPEHFVWDELDLAKVDLEGYVKVALEQLPQTPCEVLDVGCGDGWVAAQMERLGYRVTGIDYSERGVAFSRIVAPGSNFHVLDVRQLGERTEWRGAFDAAIHVEVLEHLPEQYHLDVLRGIHACLKPDGIFVLTVPSTNIPVSLWHYKHFDRDEGTQLLHQSGFDVVKIINQRATTRLLSPVVTRLLRNRYYDLRILRRAIKDHFLRRLNVVEDPMKAARYVYVAKPKDRHAVGNLA